MPNQKDAIYTDAVPDMDAIIHDLHVLHDATTKGDWRKGATTHETVAIGEKGKSYHVATFRHAADAAFVDAAHRFIKPVLDELARLREIVGDKVPEETARVKAEVVIDDEAIEKRFVNGLPKSDASTLDMYVEWFNLPGKIIEMPNTPEGKKVVVLAALASDELRMQMQHLEGMHRIESRESLFDYFIRNAAVKHTYYSEQSPEIQKDNNFVLADGIVRYAVTDIRIVEHEGRQLLVGLVDNASPVGSGVFGVACYSTHRRVSDGGLQSEINLIFGFYPLLKNEIPLMIERDMLVRTGGAITRHSTIEEYLNKQKLYGGDSLSHPALFPAALTEEIALQIIEGESNMGFSQNGEVGNWTFSVWSEPTLIGLEALLYLGLLKGWGGGIPVDAGIRELTISDPSVPYGYTVAEASKIINDAAANGFEFNGVSTSKGGRCWCSEIETVPLLQAVLTVIYNALVKEDIKPIRIVDEINSYLNPDKEVTGE